MRDLVEATHQLLWSLWSELGTPGGGRAHQRLAIDPEPLIVFTPHLGDRDHRLLGLAFDWCRLHADRVSRSRLSGLGNCLPDLTRSRFAGFSGALAAHGIVWRPAGRPLDLQENRQQMALPLERPALLAFRIRALAGISTRADVLTRLLFAPPPGGSVSELTPSGMSRRSVELTLNELARAGLVQVRGSPRRRRFQLTDRASLSRLTGADDLGWWDLHRVLLLLVQLHELVARKDPSERINRVAAVSAGKDLRRSAAAINAAPPPSLDGRADAFEGLATWGVELARQLARGG